MRRTVLGFSIRIDATAPLSEMQSLVEQALGCTLVEAQYHGTPILMSELLGMRILLSRWRGLNRVETFQLHGVVNDVRFLDTQASETDVGPLEINISQAIIDLLSVRGAGEWRIPSQAEIKAESEYGEEVDRMFHTPEGGPQFGPEDDE